MNKYLYIFGYKTPEETDQSSNASSPGLDASPQKTAASQTHSLAIFIEAPSEQAALVWGREISEEFTRRLFHNKKISWKEMKLPHCIADESFLECPSKEVRQIPVVPCGQYPNFAAMIKRSDDYYPPTLT